MDILPTDLQNIIYNYKYEIETSYKYKNVINEIKNINYELFYVGNNLHSKRLGIEYFCLFNYLYYLKNDNLFIRT